MDLLPGLFRDAASVGLVAQNGGGGAGSGSTSTTSSGELKDSESRSVWIGMLDARCVCSVLDMGWRIHVAELGTRISTQGYIQHVWGPQGAKPVCRSCFPEVENHCQECGNREAAFDLWCFKCVMFTSMSDCLIFPISQDFDEKKSLKSHSFIKVGLQKTKNKPKKPQSIKTKQNKK